MSAEQNYAKGAKLAKEQLDRLNYHISQGKTFTEFFTNGLEVQASNRIRQLFYEANVRMYIEAKR